jgi:hypothetical protein
VGRQGLVKDLNLSFHDGAGLADESFSKGVGLVSHAFDSVPLVGPETRQDTLTPFDRPWVEPDPDKQMVKSFCR